MQVLFEAFDIAGPAADARAAVLACIALGLIVMAICFLKSVLFSGGHDSRRDVDDN